MRRVPQVLPSLLRRRYEARQQAQAERLTLLVADNNSGYFLVTLRSKGGYDASILKGHLSKPYTAKVTRGGKSASLGYFATAEEAALCVARSPEGRKAGSETGGRKAANQKAAGQKAAGQKAWHNLRGSLCKMLTGKHTWCPPVSLPALGSFASEGEAQAHFEQQFASWMTWDNYGKHLRRALPDTVWQIGHWIPVSAYDAQIEEDRRRCFAPANVRPQCAKDNNDSGCRMPTDEWLSAHKQLWPAAWGDQLPVVAEKRSRKRPRTVSPSTAAAPATDPAAAPAAAQAGTSSNAGVGAARAAAARVAASDPTAAARPPRGTPLRVTTPQDWRLFDPTLVKADTTFPASWFRVHETTPMTGE